MPNAKIHDRIGKASGAVVAVIKANRDGLTAAETALEGIGGYFGGSWGAKLPDVFDPPSIGPRHRGSFHGIFPAIRYLPAAFTITSGMQNDLRQNARQLIASGTENKNSLEGAVQILLGGLLFVAAGAVYGIPVGYTSHLFADAGSKEGLPMLLGHDLPRMLKELT